MQNTYRRPAPQEWRRRWMRRFGMDVATAPLTKNALTLPNWMTGKSIIFFFVAMFACWFVYGYIPGFDLIMAASISIVLFFYGAKTICDSRCSEKAFIKRILIIGVVIRILWGLYCYFVFNPDHYNTTYGDGADTQWYMEFGLDIAKWIENGFDRPFGKLKAEWLAAIDDVGYPVWLGIVYFLTGSQSDVFIPFMVKSLMSAYCAISIYHIAMRHYGEGAARLAAVFVCLNPNMIYWSASMMKEAEMVFFVCLSVDNLDKALSSGHRLTIQNLWPGVLAGFYLFFFRAALGMVLFLAVFAHIVMASSRVMSYGKKIFAGLLVAATLMVGMGDSLRSRVEFVKNTAQSDEQKANMEWRAHRKDSGGRTQAFARYAGAAVFAPLIFAIPFPTFNEADAAQLLQVQLAGGSYIKNIFSFFVIVVMLMMLISGEWRRHVFIIAYTAGYLMSLVLSQFAQSGRFHMPVIPMLMLFAAYGIQIAKTNAKLKRWFPIVLIIEVVACLAWNWFKLKGRGMI